MDCEFIREVVEKESGIEDISLYSRKRYLTNSRFVYFALCRDFLPEVSLKRKAIGVGLSNHATVINGLKKFDELKDSKYFEIYNKCFVYLSLALKEDKVLDFNSINEATKHYRIKHILTTAKYHEVINKLQNRILTLSKNR